MHDAQLYVPYSLNLYPGHKAYIQGCQGNPRLVYTYTTLRPFSNKDRH